MTALVAIGDSLTQGFQSAAIYRVDLSYPAMIAQCMGLEVGGFRTPDFTGTGGLPCNFEWIARRLQHDWGPHLDVFTWPGAILDIGELLDEVEEYWERGRGSQPAKDELYHNLAIWGFEVGDAYRIRAGDAYNIAAANRKVAWFHPPSEPRMRTAWRVLNPGLAPTRTADTQIEVARRIAQTEGGIENLIVWLGANNCLGTVTDLEIRLTSKEPPGPFSDRTLWTPEAFRAEYDELEAGIASVGAKNVFLATVPHVTIPPVTRGINEGGGERLPKGEKYFDYYARCFVDPASFDPDRDSRLTKAEAKQIDSFIDEYNAHLRNVAEKRQWHIVDVCALLDGLAVKRNQGTPTIEVPNALRDLDVRFAQYDRNGRLTRGGLIGLDGVHPTTCGYAVVAREFIRVMNTTRPASDAIPEPDYARIRAADSLVSSAPKTLADIERFVQVLEEHFHWSRWMRHSEGRVVPT
jgi:hypothetical protein